jgi:hypothetical protein
VMAGLLAVLLRAGVREVPLVVTAPQRARSFLNSKSLFSLGGLGDSWALFGGPSRDRGGAAPLQTCRHSAKTGQCRCEQCRTNRLAWTAWLLLCRQAAAGWWLALLLVCAVLAVLALDF